MPDLVGMTTEQARAELPGVKVTVVKSAAPSGEKEGTVLSTDPEDHLPGGSRLHVVGLLQRRR